MTEGKECPKRSGLFLVFSTLLLFLLGGCLPSDSEDSASLPAGVINLSKSSTVSFAPAIASSEDIVYIVWTDRTSGNQEIFMVRSGDGGLSFSSPINISETADPSNNPKIAVSGTSLYIVWEEFLSNKRESDILFKKAEDIGGSFTWSKSMNLSLSHPVCNDSKGPVGDPCPSQFPTIVADSDEILVAWSESLVYVLKEITTQETTGVTFERNKADIFLVGSSNRGETFDLFSTLPTPSISNDETSISLNPTLAAAPGRGTFYVAWSELDFSPPNNQPKDTKIFFKTFDGFDFKPLVDANEIPVSGSIKGSGSPNLALADGNTYLVFEGTPTLPSGCTPSSDIFFSKSPDDFATVPTPVNISKSKCRASGGKISVSGNNIYIVWEDNSPGLNGILFRKSTNGGIDFSDAAKLTHAGSSVAAPAISASPTNLFSAWEDALLGNLEIFFGKR